MKYIIGTIILIFLLAGCSSEPEIIDDGTPGRIRVIVFQDNNGNRTQDQGEPGIIDRVSLAQNISCPSGRPDIAIQAETDTAGETIYEDLQPGKYCVMYLGGKSSTTPINSEIYLSSSQEGLVMFGVKGD